MIYMFRRVLGAFVLALGIPMVLAGVAFLGSAPERIFLSTIFLFGGIYLTFEGVLLCFVRKP